MLLEFCCVSESEYDDFVGLKFVDGKPKVTFPRGFRMSNDEKQTRLDILRLLAILQRFSGKKEGTTVNPLEGEENLTLPILSYQYIIRDFLAHGYYVERETQYKDGQKGKINWKRTVQRKQPVINNNNLIYLDFVIKTNKTNKNNLITKIHEFCVRESFERLGWLYLTNDILPKKPSIKFNKNMFLSVLNDALKNTFNDRKRLLFTSMINIVKSKNESIHDINEVAFGVNRFEYVWENMIDYVFGEDSKEIYFPHAHWHIVKENSYKKESSALEPDTVIKMDDRIYIIDAKYYKFGITENPMHLPATSSIQKQITYGKYAQKKGFAASDKIYNAFVMPFNSKGKEPYKFVSVGTADWEDYKNAPPYYYVLGILLDTRYIIDNYAKHNLSEIEKLTNLIEESLENYRASENVQDWR